MNMKSNPPKAPAEQVVKDIRRATRRHYSTEDKIRIVLSGLRGEDSIAELCRKEGIAQGLYYSWSKEFLEAGKKRLAGDSPARLIKFSRAFILCLKLLANRSAWCFD
jgi:transposase